MLIPTLRIDLPFPRNVPVIDNDFDICDEDHDLAPDLYDTGTLNSYDEAFDS